MLKSKVIVNDCNGEEFVSKSYLRSLAVAQLRVLDNAVYDATDVFTSASRMVDVALVTVVLEGLELFSESEIIDVVNSFHSERGEKDGK